MHLIHSVAQQVPRFPEVGTEQCQASRSTDLGVTGSSSSASKRGWAFQGLLENAWSASKLEGEVPSSWFKRIPSPEPCICSLGGVGVGTFSLQVCRSLDRSAKSLNVSGPGLSLLQMRSTGDHLAVFCLFSLGLNELACPYSQQGLGK